jgi:pilus assembly protein CpaF
VAVPARNLAALFGIGEGVKGLLERVLDHPEIADLDRAGRRLALRSIVADSVPESETAEALDALADMVEGPGRLGPLMRDPEITDILINGPHEIWTERGGTLELSHIRFEDESELAAFVERAVGEAGGHLDLARPIADARLSDGSRMHVAMAPVAVGGPFVSIRRFPQMPMTLEDLQRAGMMSVTTASELRFAVNRRASIAISGATGSGKTTLLNALLGCVGPHERIVTIEETPELRPPCSHALSLVARRANVEGVGEITPADLVRTALRMRPDRIIVGEVRGGEMLAALAAMSTGHEGSMLTVHAQSASQAIERMVGLGLSADSGMNESSLRQRISYAFDFIVHLHRSGGKRLVETVEKVQAKPD